MINPDYEEYAIKHSSDETEILKQLNRETHLKILQPRMLSGHLQGKLLELLSCMIKPNRILEIGTYTGYSAIALAQGLTENGILHTIDINVELENIVKDYIKKSGFENKIKIHIGDAMQIIPQIDEIYDLVFIDADKENYINYFNLVIEKVSKGGFIIADNVLWSGKVLNEAQKNDIDTINLQKFNKLIKEDNRVENLLLPFRDGLMIMKKI
jgi:caffeoyl-CoA O-methyltransferase